jgi:type I restriction enzyme, S subunit
MNWTTMKLQELVSTTKGKKQQEVDNPSAKRYIQIEDLNGNYTPKFTQDKGVDVLDNDVIIAWDGANAGKVGTNLMGIIGSTLARLRLLSDRINANYLFRYLQTKESEIRLKRTGATIPHINGQDLKNLKIPIPPLTIQKKIASILDKADDLRKKDKTLLNKYDELLQAVFHDMFGDPVKNEKGWEMKSLGSISIKITDGTHQSPKFLDEGVPFLLVSNIVDNEICYETKKFISRKAYEELIIRTPIEIGDILLTTVGSYGNSAMIKSNKEFCFQRHIAYVKPNHNLINVEYLFGVLKSDFVKYQIEKKVKGVAQKTLNLGDLKSLQILFPPFRIQNRFGSIAQNIQQQKKQIKLQVKQSEKLFQSLLQRAFKGELVK